MNIQIANPLYDVVFKYLMEDNDVAKTIISTIIDEDIEVLEFLPQERIFELEDRSLTVYRLDFSAKIKTDQGHYKHVIIEIQKAKLPSDIMRFRRYLGKQYSQRDNVTIDNINGKSLKKAMPILTIYFLGHRLKTFQAPAIKVKRSCIDIRTGKTLIGKEEFVESLTHDSFIIQIPELNEETQTEIESLLKIFDQRYITDSSQHVLSINEDDYPKKYRNIIRRLQKAIAEPEMKDKMDMEDDILEDLQNMERDIADKEKIIQEKDKVIQEKDSVIRKKDNDLKDKDSVIKKQGTDLIEKDKLIEELKNALSKQSKKS